MTRLVENIRASNSSRQAMVEAEQHIERALAKLEFIETCAESDALENLAKYIVDRKV